MKIAFIVQWFPALSESFILSQITHMIDRGHTVEILSQYRTDETLLHQSVVDYGLLSRTSFGYSIPRSKVLCRLKAAAVLAVRFLRSPRQTIRLIRACWHGGNRFDYPALFLGLRCLDRSFDLIHAHFGPSGNTGLALKRAGIAPRLLTSFHGCDYQMAVGKLRTMYQDLFRSADLLLANSPSTRDKMIELGAVPDSIRIHPMGIDPARFGCRPRPPKLTPDPLRILTVARYVTKKGLDYGIRAFRKVKDRYPNRQLFYDMVGLGPEQQSLQRLIAELDLSQSVSLLGPRTNEEVVAMMSQTDLFMLPSLVEPLGVVLLEAQASGLPIVATEVDGIPFAVVPGRSALLVPPADADALADKLCWLINNPHTWSDMARVGREYVKSRFDIQILNNDLDSLCYQLLDASQIENGKSKIVNVPSSSTVRPGSPDPQNPHDNPR
jgi:colanic acid/amylovoran biosynthesis glycosyltransferase